MFQAKVEEKSGIQFQILHHSMNLLHKPCSIRMLRNIHKVKQQQSAVQQNFYVAYQFSGSEWKIR